MLGLGGFWLMMIIVFTYIGLFHFAILMRDVQSSGISAKLRSSYIGVLVQTESE